MNRCHNDICVVNNNNDDDNNNNCNDNIYGAVIVAQSHCESSPSSYDEYGTAPSGRRPSDQAKRPGLSPPVGCQKPHPPSPFIIITQPESWYSFYHPADDRRLSRPQWFYEKNMQMPAVGFEPWSSHTSVRHVTARPLRHCKWQDNE